MDFKKDLLLIDIEFTGLDLGKHEIIQLAALLLDKKTLKEKKSFCAFIKPQKWANRDLKSMAINGISWEKLKNAGNLKTVLSKFNKFANQKNAVLSYYGGPADMDFLRVAYKKAGIKWQFDYHFFNLWAVFYHHFAVKDQLRNKARFAGFSLEDLMRRFNIKSGKRHDALEDCRIEAEVLRRIIKKI